MDVLPQACERRRTIVVFSLVCVGVASAAVLWLLGRDDASPDRTDVVGLPPERVAPSNPAPAPAEATPILAAVPAPEAADSDEPQTEEAAAEPEKPPRFHVTLRGDGTLAFGDVQHDLDGDASTPEERRIEAQDRALEDLRQALRASAEQHGREADGSSRVVILVTGDREAKWKYVQWVMQVAAEMRIYRMHFRVVPKPS
jgi:biopolymer transport protein ExbD